MPFIRIFLPILLFGGFILQGFGQKMPETSYEFIPNLGQWEAPFLYQARVKGGQIFLEKDGFTYDIWNEAQRNEIIESYHHHQRTPIPLNRNSFQAHAIRMKLVGMNPKVTAKPSEQKAHYLNYFLGNDSARWKTQVPVYQKITYEHVYPGIHLHVYTGQGQFKYDFEVLPGANWKAIQMQYAGQFGMRIKKGALIFKTAVGEVVEQPPVAWIQKNGVKELVPFEFDLRKNTVQFDANLPNTLTDTLIIDPALIFGTYSGATADNWGFTATYDNQGNMYGGGIVFAGNIYPGNPGDYQANYGGGIYDIMIAKFSPDGSNLLYYTYLGGTQAELPYSLVVNTNNELTVLGSTGSAGFPTTPGAVQPNFRGGPSITVFSATGVDFPQGSDLFVTRFSASGTTLVASTFLGGSRNDGLNNSTALVHNYADNLRGEVITDANGNTYLVSCTESGDFPIQNPVQPAINGVQDAIVTSLNSGFTAFNFSTYLGGSNADAGYSIQRNSAGNIYVTGGTTSNTFPTTVGTVRPAFGGTVDGFVVRYNATGTAILNATYLGTSAYDQCYVLQLDQNEDVYVVGQTRGAYPVVSSPAGPVYSNANSGQFIHKLNPTLTATIFSTVFGRGAFGQIDIVPTAFLVDVCNHIYVAGWGGSVNSGFSGGSTTGLPVTLNAHQLTTDGSDFYFIVLDENATGLIYASYFGGVQSAEHVDGGTSRFNPDGIIYEAVCAGCGGLNDFPTTPGAYSNTNQSNNPISNCNLGLFKFDVSEFSAIIDPQTPTTVCQNNVVTLNNASTGGTSVFWDFGDGNTSTSNNVSHSYANPGTYTVMLIVSAPGACIPSDTAFLNVIVNPSSPVQVDTINPICPGGSVQLNASGSNSYSWSPPIGLSAANIANPVASPAATTTYTVTGTNSCGTSTATVTVDVVNFQLTVSTNDTICLGGSAQLNASGGISYTWNNTAWLNNPNIPNPVATPTNTTFFVVTATGPQNCILTDSVRVQVDTPLPPSAGPDLLVCLGSSITLTGTGGNSYVWSPTTYLNNPNSPTPTATPINDITYFMTAINACGAQTDTIFIDVLRVVANGSPDTIVCPGERVTLWSSGGVSYAWQPANLVNDPTNDTVITTPPALTNYFVTVTDSNGCSTVDTIQVQLFPTPTFDLGPDIIIAFGDSARLTTNIQGQIQWSPAEWLSCINCTTTYAAPPTTTPFYLTVTDVNGCRFADSVLVIVEGSLYIPNTFTPDGTGLNEFFRAYGKEIKDFKMWIFNRWGQEIFFTNKLEAGWNGYHGGKESPIGVYVWKVEYEEISGRKGVLYGHVNLLR